MKLTEFIQDIGKPVAFYPGLKKITKSTTATLLLCQLIYWMGKQADINGWIFKESDELEIETGLSYDEQKTAREHLLKLGFIEEKYHRLDHKMAFKVKEDQVNESWENASRGIPESRVGALGNGTKAGSLNSSSESTSENTTKNLPPKKQAGRAPKNPEQPTLIDTEEAVKPPSNHNVMVSILARLCMMDVKLSASRIGATSSKLLKAGYVPADLETFERWWKEKDFRGVKGECPTLAVIESKIYQAKQEMPALAAPKKKTQWIEHRGTNGELLLEEVEVE